MGTVRREVLIDRPVEEVWAVLGDPTTIHEWFPGMVDTEVDGTTRVITTSSGIPIPEEIVTNDAILHRFQYRVSAPFMTEHLGTIDAFDLGDGRTLVSYATDAEPDAMALIVGGATGSALKELKRQLEGAEQR
jgi:uncharacterized protein YndB with AHSA1/START domain